MPTELVARLFTLLFTTTLNFNLDFSCTNFHLDKWSRRCLLNSCHDILIYVGETLVMQILFCACIVKLHRLYVWIVKLSALLTLGYACLSCFSSCQILLSHQSLKWRSKYWLYSYSPFKSSCKKFFLLLLLCSILICVVCYFCLSTNLPDNCVGKQFSFFYSLPYPTCQRNQQIPTTVTNILVNR